MLELQISAPSGVDPSSMPASVLPDEPGTTSADNLECHDRPTGQRRADTSVVIAAVCLA
jgi:hypothetical protein